MINCFRCKKPLTKTGTSIDNKPYHIECYHKEKDEFIGGYLDGKMKKEKLYVVLSRDNGLVCVTKDKETAEKERKEQSFKEEFSGGRPSVYITETNLK